MASSPASSSSSSTSAVVWSKKCFYCRYLCAQFRIGWKLSNGNYAALCDTCASAYESGSFCSIFHWNSDGWRMCVSCDHMMHCGCIMSSHTYVMLDIGGVACLPCLRKNINKHPKPVLEEEATSKRKKDAFTGFL